MNYEDYTQPMRQQIKQALLRYYFENKPSWYGYHSDILKKIGIKEDDTRLHERDPRNWIIDGHEPSEPKFMFYAQFIEAVYPDLKLHKTLAEEHIALGLTLSRFSIGDQGISDKTFLRQAVDLNKRFFVSKKYHEELLQKDSALFTLMQFRVVAASPFLLVYRFRLCGFRTVSPKAQEILALLNKTADFPNSLESEKSASLILDNNYDDLIGTGSAYITNLEKGIMCPSDENGTYHGILQSEDYTPSHIIMRKHTSKDAVSITSIGQKDMESKDHLYGSCSELTNFDLMISSMGDLVI